MALPSTGSKVWCRAPLWAMAWWKRPSVDGHGQQVRHAERPSRLAADGDAFRIAAERRDVVADPTDGGHLVEGSVDAASGEVVAQVRSQVAEPERGEPVVDGDHDDVAPGGERRAVIPRH